MGFKGVYKMLNESLREVSKVFVSRKFKGVLRKIKGSSESPLRVIQESFKVYVKEVQWVFQGSFKDIFRKIQGC